MISFSILVAHYNNFAYFRECYESLQQQTHKDFEIIVVDDGSSDDSFKNLQELVTGDDKVKLFRNAENKGVGFTKKRCIELASGTFCGFVDPDDKLTAEAIEESVKAYEATTVATYSQLYLCDENLHPKNIFPNTCKIKNGSQLFFNINFQVAHFFTFRKSSYLQTEGIRAHYQVAEDQDLILKLYEQGDFKYIQKPLYYYRVHTQGLSHQTEKLAVKQKNWHQVLQEAVQRRHIKKLYSIQVEKIHDLPAFLYRKQNTPLKKILRKFFVLK